MTDTPARLLLLLALLQRRERWTGPELADTLEVTTRTVRRDIDRLRTLGYPVDAEPGAAGGYRLGVGPTMPPLLLDEDEATAIALALGTAVSGGVDAVAEPAVSALAKLDRVLPAAARTRLNAVRVATEPLRSVDAVDAAVLVTVARAAADSERLRLVYVDRQGTRTERRVDPYRLVPTGRRWYLVCFDADRRDWRTLRLDRIESVERTGHVVRLVDPPDATALVSEASGVSPYRWQAEVLVRAAPDEVRRRIPATVGHVAPHPDGAVLTVGSDDLDALVGNLVALGLPCTVVSPPELRDRLLDAARRILADHP